MTPNEAILLAEKIMAMDNTLDVAKELMDLYYKAKTE